MVETSDSIVTNRPVQEVFDFVTNVVNDPTWHTDVLEAQQTQDGPIGLGTVWHARFKPSMGISEGDMEVVTFEPNRLQVMNGHIGPMSFGSWQLLDPSGTPAEMTSDRQRIPKASSSKPTGPLP